MKVTAARFAGPLHGVPTRQTGVIGPIVTDPQMIPVARTASGTAGA
jgi:hypothetical protein